MNKKIYSLVFMINIHIEIMLHIKANKIVDNSLIIPEVQMLLETQ